jgi:hypothetical protein
LWERFGAKRPFRDDRHIGTLNLFAISFQRKGIAMFTKLLVAAALLASAISLKPADIVDSVGWQTLRNSAIIAFPLPL